MIRRASLGSFDLYSCEGSDARRRGGEVRRGISIHTPVKGVTVNYSLSVYEEIPDVCAVNEKSPNNSNWIILYVLFR